MNSQKRVFLNKQNDNENQWYITEDYYIKIFLYSSILLNNLLSQIESISPFREIYILIISKIVIADNF